MYPEKGVKPDCHSHSGCGFFNEVSGIQTVFVVYAALTKLIADDITMRVFNLVGNVGIESEYFEIL